MRIYFVCDLSKSEKISIFHLIGYSEFVDTKRKMDLDNYVIIDTFHEDLETCVKSFVWVSNHSINKTILNLITHNL